MADIVGIVLQMKGMHIDRVVNFPFPTPPDRESLNQAEKVCFSFQMNLFNNLAFRISGGSRQGSSHYASRRFDGIISATSSLFQDDYPRTAIRKYAVYYLHRRWTLCRRSVLDPR